MREGGRARCRRLARWWTATLARSAREPGVAMCQAPCGRVARVRLYAAQRRATGHRTPRRLRRSGRGICAHRRRHLTSRVPACRLVRDPVLLSELPPKARAAVWQVDRGERARARDGGGALSSLPAHRQYVFTLPKPLRPVFSRQWAWPVDGFRGALAQGAARAAERVVGDDSGGASAVRAACRSSGRGTRVRRH